MNIDKPEYKIIKDDLISYINSLSNEDEKREMREYMIDLGLDELNEMLNNKG